MTLRRISLWVTLVLMAAGVLAPTANIRAAEDVGGSEAAVRKHEVLIANVLDDLFKNQRQGMMNVDVRDGELLRTLTLAANARHVVEIGTSNGYSTLWFCSALVRTGGKVTTFEINEQRAGLARQNFERAQVADMVTLILGDAHKEVSRINEPIDVLFLDADKEGYLDYLNKLLPKLRPNGLILAHNTTNLRGPMRDYIQAVTTNPQLVTIFLLEDGSGVGVTVKKKQLSSDPAGKERPRQAILGYINAIPPESDADRERRHRRVAARRSYVPILVHRGASTDAPENTLEAYAAAMDLGADGVEIDLRRSADGVIYLHHDDNLGRTVSGSGKVSEKTYYELLEAGMTRRFGRATGETRVPTFAAFLQLARQRAMLIHLDVKEAGLQEEIMRLLDEADVWDHIVSVNRGNADKIADSPKVKAIAYKGWWPDNATPDNPDAVRVFLEQPGGMIFTKDPRVAVKAMNRPVPADPRPLPADLRALWLPEGVFTGP